MSKSTKNNPLVSILIPTYNSSKYLGQCLESALAQTYKNIEIIVHDDASTDGTKQLLSKYQDSRLRIIQTDKNHGMIGGWNYIQSKAKGKYIKFLASDDLLAPTCVSELIDKALESPKSAIITCRRKFINEQGKVIKTLGFAKVNTTTNGLAHAKWILTTLRENLIGEPTAVMYPRNLVALEGGYDPLFSQFADFEYWIRLLQYGDITYVHKPLCSFRVHTGSNTSKAILDGRFITEIFKLIHKYYDNLKYLKVFSLTESDRRAVKKMKILDTLKNIKDLIIEGKTSQASRYFIRLISSSFFPSI